MLETPLILDDGCGGSVEPEGGGQSSDDPNATSSIWTLMVRVRTCLSGVPRARPVSHSGDSEAIRTSEDLRTRASSRPPTCEHDVTAKATGQLQALETT